jgi:hypothetical protein
MFPSQNGRLTVSGRDTESTDFRSDEVRELLGAVPHWTVRAGPGYLLLLMLITLAIAWFIHFPDHIDAPALLTTQRPPASVVAQSSGYLVLWARDKERVSEGQYLGYLTNPTNVDVPLRLKRDLAAFKARVDSNAMYKFDYRPYQRASLGALQEPYAEFLRALRDYALSQEQRIFQRQRSALERQITDHRSLIDQTRAANAILREELDIAGQAFAIDSALHSRQMSSQAEYQEKKRRYLAAQRDYGSVVAGVTTLSITLRQLEDRVRESMQQEEKQRDEHLQAIESSMKRLEETITTWERAYLLKAPMDGSVALHGFWSDHQYIKAGDEILSVVSSNENVFGRVEAPVERSGKIRVGQRVRLRFANYPSEEYGVVNGVVREISLLPRAKVYAVAIGLPNGLRTSSGRTLEFRQDMNGTATIVTDDLRLLERIFYQARRLLSQ